MKKIIMLIGVLSFLGIPLSGAENLLPAVSTAKQVWYEARNVECAAKFECDEKASALRIGTIV